MVMDVCGAPALVARVVREYAERGRRARPWPSSAAPASPARCRSPPPPTPGPVAASPWCPVAARGRPARRHRPGRRGRHRRRPQPAGALGGRRRGRRTGRRHGRLRRRAGLRAARHPVDRPGRHRSSTSRWRRTSPRPRSAPRAWQPTSACWWATATSPATRHTPSTCSAATPRVRGLFEGRLADVGDQRPSAAAGPWCRGAHDADHRCARRPRPTPPTTSSWTCGGGPRPTTSRSGRSTCATTRCCASR